MVARREDQAGSATDAWALTRSTQRTFDLDLRWTLQRGRAQLQARRTVREHRCAPSPFGRDARLDASGSKPPARLGVGLLAVALVLLLVLNVMLLLGLVPSEYYQLTGGAGGILGEAVGATLIAMTFAVGGHVSDRLRRRHGEPDSERGAASRE
ncbi:MAG: hypothetical protein ACRDTT_01235 [Pseudonocardiaceae bacterium]